MPLPTSLTLELVELAIAKIAAGAQEYALPDGTLVKKADLNTLMDLRARLQAERNASGVVGLGSAGGVWRPVAVKSGRHLS